MINHSKIEPQLQNALEATPQELTQSPELAFGSTSTVGAAMKWEVILRYSGEWENILLTHPDMEYTLLLGQYAIAKLTEEELRSISNLPQILFVEKTKRFYYELYHNQAHFHSPDTLRGQQQNTSLSGRGVLVAVIDSGIDYFHPDFRNPDGTTRIVKLWDQNLTPDPAWDFFSPEGYHLGVVFDAQHINRALSAPTAQESLAICPSTDRSGHGTFVAGVAAGNGSSSAGIFRGVAYEADLLVVKVESAYLQADTGTGSLMQAIDFCVRESIRRGQPLSINLSYGNSYGSHAGTALLENYIDSIFDFAKCNISVGSGNEGAAPGHTGAEYAVRGRNELFITDYVTSLSVQLWKNYLTDINLQILTPSLESLYVVNRPGVSRYRVGNTTLLVAYGEPTPYSPFQEIYMEFFPDSSYLAPGIWQFAVNSSGSRNTAYELWLPVESAISGDAAFLQPDPYLTLTIPSSSSGCITVGAYDSVTDTYAPFSGRGDLRKSQSGQTALPPWSAHSQKPDLVAPGVEITSCAVGGGYTQRTGTSMATPFVAGSAALLMQWGIVEGNDPFLYGEKLKAYLCKGARPLPGFSQYPNPQVGWGALSLADSFPS